MKNVVSVRRRNQSGLLEDNPQALNSCAPVLQALFSKVDTLQKKVEQNAVVKAQDNTPAKVAPEETSKTEKTASEKSRKSKRRSFSKRMSDLFD